MDIKEREARVRQTFDTVAESYDHPGSFWFDLTAKALARAAHLKPEEEALDLATGTGKVALALAASEPDAHVVGFDLSDGMLAQARQKGKALGLANTEFTRGSFNEMSFGERFDALTCSFGLFFVETMAETLRRFAEQVKPGGRILISTFALGSFSPFSDAFQRLYADFGFEVAPPPWLRVATEEQIHSLFHEAGLQTPEVTEHDFGQILKDEQAWWDIVYNAGYRGMLQQMTEERAARFKAQHLEEIRAMMQQEGGSRLNVTVLISSCDKL